MPADRLIAAANNKARSIMTSSARHSGSNAGLGQGDIHRRSRITARLLANAASAGRQDRRQKNSILLSDAYRDPRRARPPYGDRAHQIINTDSRIVDDNGQNRPLPSGGMMPAIFTQILP
jgi:hypothetical protein